MKIQRKLLLTLGASATIMLLSLIAGLNARQALAVSLFTGTITALIFFWHLKVPITFLGVSLLVTLGLIDVPHLIEAANLDVILFLIDMMIVTRFLENRRFFEYIISVMLSKVGRSGFLLITILMLLSALFASLVGAVVSALFMTTSIVHLASRLRLNITPLVLMITFAINIGSSATVVGNPVGVLIAMKGGLTFSDFLRWATPISLASLALAIMISFRMFRKEIRMLDRRLKEQLIESDMGKLGSMIPENDLMICWALFLGTILGLLFSHQLEELLHLEKNTMLIGVSLLSATATLLIEKQRARELIERGVDWWTLMFFMMLFASVGALEYVGVTDVLANAITDVPGGTITRFILLTLLTGALSAFLDNVLAVATIVPVIKGLGEMGYDTYPFWWGALFAGTFFGNLTLIASTANIVAISMLERRGLGRISFKEWLKKGFVITMPTIGLAILLLALQLMP